MGLQNKYLKNYYEYFHTLNIIFYLGIGLPLTLFIVLYLQYDKQGQLAPLPSSPNIFLHFGLPLIALICIYFAYKLYGVETTHLPTELSFKEKLYKYMIILIKKYTLLTVACLVMVVGFYFSQQEIFSIYYIITLVFFSLNRPRDYKMARDLQLDQEERQKLYSHKDF